MYTETINLYLSFSSTEYVGLLASLLGAVMTVFRFMIPEERRDPAVAIDSGFHARWMSNIAAAAYR